MLAVVCHRVSLLAEKCILGKGKGSSDAQHTIPQNKLADPRNIHSNSPEEVVVPTKPNQTSRRRTPPPAQQDKHRARVRDQEAEKTKERGVSEALGEITAGCIWLEEEALVFVGGEIEGDLAGKVACRGVGYGGLDFGFVFFRVAGGHGDGGGVVWWGSDVL